MAESESPLTHIMVTRGAYSPDHTAGMYLLAPGGQFLARFPYGTPTADIATRIGEEMRKPPTQPQAPVGEAEVPKTAP